MSGRKMDEMLLFRRLRTPPGFRAISPLQPVWTNALRKSRGTEANAQTLTRPLTMSEEACNAGCGDQSKTSKPTVA